MINTVPYLHVLDGRIRIKIPEVKRSPLKAFEIEQTLREMDGITQVQANPTTGNVLILFESNVISAEKILKTLKPSGHYENRGGAAQQMSHELVSNQNSLPPIAFFGKSAELVAERLILALICRTLSHL